MPVMPLDLPPLAAVLPASAHLLRPWRVHEPARQRRRADAALACGVPALLAHAADGNRSRATHR